MKAGKIKGDCVAIIVSEINVSIKTSKGFGIGIGKEKIEEELGKHILSLILLTLVIAYLFY